jgi:ATP-dependent helicase/nuclease subunit B
VGTNLATPQLAIEENVTLDSALAEKLYGNELPLSVSALERFAACPFKFFLEYGLRARERKEFLLDVREQGTFQHLVLSKFHEELAAEGLKWRDITPDQARVRVERIADAIISTFENGLLESTAENRFTAATYKSALQDLMAVLIDWCRTNKFNAEAVEFGFGRDGSVPAWRIPVDAKHAVVLYGRVDRIDLHRVSETEALCVVFDYKSGLQSPHRTLLHHGVQQQLPAYLLTLASLREAAQHFNVKKLTPAGCFLLPFRSKQAAQKTRREALDKNQTAVRNGYMHEGLFDIEHLKLFDSLAPAEKSGQFKYRVKKSGEPWTGSFNALSSDEFAAVLKRSEELIRDSAKRIYSGDISIRPYKHGAKTPCERCDYQAVCRFDPWTQPYNILRDPAEAEGSDE